MVHLNWFHAGGSEFLQVGGARNGALVGRTHDKLILGAARRGNVAAHPAVAR